MFTFSQQFNIISKARSKNLVSSKKLFQLQDQNIVTRRKLLYYTKDISTTMLNSVSTSINLINKARYQTVDIILNNNDICLIFGKFIIKLIIIAIYFQINLNILLYSHLLKTILLCQYIFLKLVFLRLNLSVIPIFPINLSLQINEARLI